MAQLHGQNRAGKQNSKTQRVSDSTTLARAGAPSCQGWGTRLRRLLPRIAPSAAHVVTSRPPLLGQYMFSVAKDRASQKTGRGWSLGVEACKPCQLAVALAAQCRRSEKPCRPSFEVIQRCARRPAWLEAARWGLANSECWGPGLHAAALYLNPHPHDGGYFSGRGGAVLGDLHAVGLKQNGFYGDLLQASSCFGRCAPKCQHQDNPVISP